MDDVEAEQQRDVQAAFVHRDVLQPVDQSGIGNEQQRAELVLAQPLFGFHGVGDEAVEKLRELADFFFQRHLV